jgi:hypothetical protein
VKKKRERKMEEKIILHPPYSPDSPTEFWLFPKMDFCESCFQ